MGVESRPGLAGIPLPTSRHLLLKFTAPYQQWNENRLWDKGNTIDAWQAHHLGIPLALAGRTGVADRIADLDRAESDRYEQEFDKMLGKDRIRSIRMIG